MTASGVPGLVRIIREVKAAIPHHEHSEKMPCQRPLSGSVRREIELAPEDWKLVPGPLSQDRSLKPRTELEYRSFHFLPRRLEEECRSALRILRSAT